MLNSSDINTNKNCSKSKKNYFRTWFNPLFKTSAMNKKAMKLSQMCRFSRQNIDLLFD